MSERGVSLIELVIVIVALAAGLALIGTAFVAPAQSVVDNQNIQHAWQVAQACADHTLGKSRWPGQLSAVPLGTSSITFGANTCNLSVGDGCPGACADRLNCLGTTLTCRPVAASATVGGYSASVNLVLFNY